MFDVILRVRCVFVPDDLAVVFQRVTRIPIPPFVGMKVWRPELDEGQDVTVADCPNVCSVVESVLWDDANGVLVANLVEDGNGGTLNFCDTGITRDTFIGRGWR